MPSSPMVNEVNVKKTVPQRIKNTGYSSDEAFNSVVGEGVIAWLVATLSNGEIIVEAALAALLWSVGVRPHF